MFQDVSLWGALIGGLLVFFSPCILPIVPFYLSYMAGSNLAQINGEGPIPNSVRNKAVISAIMFSLGIITVFVMLGAGAFQFAKTFAQYKHILQYASAALIAVIGLHFLGAFKVSVLNKQFQSNFGDTKNMNIINSYLVGLAFAFGWTPCVGGVLTAIIMTASMENTALEGLKLLLVFGVGMTLPFVVAAFFIKPFLKFMGKFRKHMGKVEKAMGIFMLLFAWLLVSDNISVIAEWLLKYMPNSI